MLEHFKEHASGFYHLYSVSDLCDGKNVMIWPGYFDTENKVTPIDIVRNLANLTEAITSLIGVYRFFVAPLHSETRLRQRIEAAIANTLYNVPGAIGAFQDKGIRYKPRNASKKPIKCSITSTITLLGMPRSLLV